MGAREAPHGISKVKILFALAKQAKHLGAYKLARFAYDKLQHMKVPDEWQEQLDLELVTPSPCATTRSCCPSATAAARRTLY